MTNKPGAAHRRRGILIAIVAAAVAVAVGLGSRCTRSDGTVALPGGSTDITIAMVGDVMPYGMPSTSPYGATGSAKYDYNTLFQHMGDEISAADVRVLSQDTILYDTSSDGSETLDTSLSCPTAVGDAEAEAGFNLVLKANEHLFDLGHDGLASEMNFWRDSHPEVTVIGTDNPSRPDRDQDYVDNVYVYEKDGLKVAFLNYTYGVNYVVSGTDQKYYSPLNATKIERDVERAKKAGADMIVACPHWGEAYSMQLSNEETTYAKVFAETGVDVVIGTGPHVLQKVGTLTSSSGHRMLCIYSVGDFVSNQTSETSLVGGLATVTLHKDADGSCSIGAASLEPLVIYRDGTTTTTYPLSAYTTSLATTNLDGSLTRAYVDNLCRQIWGSGYDSSTGRYDIV